MKIEDKAWHDLQRRAAAQIRPDFATRVLHTARGPDVAAWRDLQARATTELRPGFAERVLRAARALPQLPSFFDQFAFSAITATACLLGVLFIHAHSNNIEEQRNLASWDQLAAEVQDVDLTQ